MRVFFTSPSALIFLVEGFLCTQLSVCTPYAMHLGRVVMDMYTDLEDKWLRLPFNRFEVRLKGNDTGVRTEKAELYY